MDLGNGRRLRIAAAYVGELTKAIGHADREEPLRILENGLQHLILWSEVRPACATYWRSSRLGTLKVHCWQARQPVDPAVHPTTEDFST
jgi:hypothetical protein